MLNLKTLKRVYLILIGTGFLILQSSISYSEPIDLDIVAVDISGVEVLVATCLVGCAMMWGIRKLIKILNRS